MSPTEPRPPESAARPVPRVSNIVISNLVVFPFLGEFHSGPEHLDAVASDAGTLIGDVFQLLASDGQAPKAIVDPPLKDISQHVDTVTIQPERGVGRAETRPNGVVVKMSEPPVPVVDDDDQVQPLNTVEQRQQVAASEVVAFVKHRRHRSCG